MKKFILRTKDTHVLVSISLNEGESLNDALSRRADRDNLEILGAVGYDLKPVLQFA